MNIQMLIAGQEANSQSGAHFVRCNPISGKAVTQAPAALSVDARLAADAAASALPGWAALGPTERRLMLLRAAASMYGWPAVSCAKPRP
jgi:benzaldehyde dehydrogenase (NAD)